MAIFMKYDGIDGESQVRGKSGYIELLSVGWGARRATSAVKGGVRGDAEVQIDEVIISKAQDRTSAQLMTECVTGAFDKTVEIEFVTTGANNRPTTFLKVRLEQCGISSYSLSGSGGGGGRPSETLTLNFTKITLESFDMNDARNAVPYTGGYDVVAGAAT